MNIKNMKIKLTIGLLVVLLVNQGACFGFMGGMMANPATVLNAARYMTQILMRNMAQKRTNDGSCVNHVSRSAVTFFNEASVSLQLGRLLQMTMRRSARDSEATAVPLDRFCQLTNVRRLRAASVTFVSRLSCLGVGAVDDTDRLFRSLVYTIEHICRDGGEASSRFLDEVSECRRLDAEHEAQIGRVRRFHRARRSITAGPLRSAAARNSTPPATAAAATGTATTAAADTDTAAIAVADTDTAATAAAATDTAATAAAAIIAVPEPAIFNYTSLQACLDDVNELLPRGAQLSPQEELTDFLLTLPALLPRLLQRDGLSQFCPALLKGADCAHLALFDCPEWAQQTMARFFQDVLRGILCDNIPDDEVLKQLIGSDTVKELYFRL